MSEDQQRNGHASWIKEDHGFEQIQELAHQLIRHLGVDGARKTCIDNRWRGVLSFIERSH